MKAFVLSAAVFLGGCASHSGALMPFTFIGVPEKLTAESYRNVHGLERSLIVKVLEVKKGSFDRDEISFGVRVDSNLPLEIGRKYRIEAAWGHHGMVILDSTLLKPEPNQSPEPTSGLRPAAAHL
jgi:hypothetical protein